MTQRKPTFDTKAFKAQLVSSILTDEENRPGGKCNQYGAQDCQHDRAGRLGSLAVIRRVSGCRHGWDSIGMDLK